MNRFWQRWAVGNSNPSNPRRIGWGILENGWQWFFDTHVVPTIEWANSETIRVESKVMLHNPFGVSTTGTFPMRASQFVGATKEKLSVVKRFKRTWRPFIRDGGELLMYLGTPFHDPRFQKELNEGRIDNWLRLFWLSYRVAMDIGASIAIDASASREVGGVDHLAYLLMEELLTYNDSPSRMYIEASPAYDKTHWHTKNVTMLESTFQKRHVIRTQPGYVRQFPVFHDGAFYDARDGTVLMPGYGGSMLRIIRNVQERNPETVQRILGDGHSVAMSPNHLKWGAEWAGTWRFSPEELFGV